MGIGEEVFAGGYSTGVHRSTDNGLTWQNVGWGPASVQAIALNSLGHVFAATDDGVYKSTDTGNTWTPVNGGLKNQNINAIAFDSDGYLFAGSNGAGIARSLLSTTDVSYDPVVPEGIFLLQNYPNPFNPSTMIRYGLPQTSFVTLTVYNTLGQQVAQLVSEQQQAGYHEAVFRGDQLASGVYFYRIQAGDFVQTKKLLLLR
ncbi:MAG: hypothetical protein HW412_1166 [Bacteroidetes bacterium]|nr:hypothetical protein [Bacteroidota bacterium]